MAFSKNKASTVLDDKAKMGKAKTFDLISLGSLLLMLVVFMYAGYFTREFTVKVMTVSQGYPFQMYSRLSANGRVVIGHKLAVSPRIAGQLTEITVERGSLVKKGQVIARIESTDQVVARDQNDANLKLANANLEQSRIKLGEAEQGFESSREMHQKGTVSDAEFNASEAAFRKAKSAVTVAEAMVRAHSAALRSAEVALGYTEVKSPFDGIVLSKNAHVGDIMRPSLSAADEEGGIVTLADVSALQVETGVPESEIGSMRIGQPCMIIVDTIKRYFRGEVDSITPPVGNDKTAAMVRVSFIDHDRRIMPDMNVEIAFLTRKISPDEDKPLIIVPRSSLVPSLGGYSVFTVRDDRAVKNKVRLGMQYRDRVEILAGIANGDLLIEVPPDGIKNGSKVIVQKD